MTDASLAPAVLENAGETPPVPWPVIEACGLPEIGGRLSGLSVRIDPGLTRPFTLDGTTITLRPDRAATVTGSALILREAIELTAAGPGPAGWAERILAHATALAYGATGLAARGEPAAFASFSPLSGSAAEMLRLHDDAPNAEQAAVDITERIARFLHERDESARPCTSADRARAVRALPFSMPTEVLLASGGDGRQTIDWDTGVNAYGITPNPTPWMSLLGSCTASSPTTRAFSAAEELRRRLIEAALDGQLDRIVAGRSAIMRQMLLTALGVTSDVDVVFTPSGTDAELVTLLVALGAGEPVHSIIVGQHEIGSGGPHAAAGCHFGARLPSGCDGRPGAPLAGLDADRVVTTTVDVRDEQGQMVDPDQLEASVERAIDAYADRYRTLVHVVEGSKTGIRLPRAGTVRSWRRRYGDRLDVVVDAAQMRVDQHTAVTHLADGNMVIVTGSKFFAGPPFSGAVIIPADLRSRLTHGRSLPAGLRDYLTRADVPAMLGDLHTAARPGLNTGLLLRWEAALAEMRSFHNVSPEIRDEVLRLLASGLREIIERTPQVTLIESPYTQIPHPDRRGLDDLPTIFTFLADGPRGQPLTMDQAKVVHRLLARDLRGWAPSDDPVLRRTFQLGQPVKIYQRDGAWVGGLRIAIGAPTVSEIVFDHTRGRVWTERVERTLADSADALHKVVLILQHVDVDTGSPRSGPSWSSARDRGGMV